MALTYDVKNLHQMGSVEFSDESADLSEVSGLEEGLYRLGVWVNSNNAISATADEGSDNVGLITLNSEGDHVKSIINYTSSTTAVMKSITQTGTPLPNPVTQDQLRQFAGSGFDSVELRDLTGQQQNIMTASKGIFILTVSKDKKIYNGKVVVQ